ncbi:MAG: TetR/AcrR family transcriptional regulator [Bifidobacteriaceae bacterium]|jgi:AcrR family transcriptional regulator|nr:TetR/AcrR family transcriptional regulator [Bifidobacteriaceae bacterium]
MINERSLAAAGGDEFGPVDSSSRHAPRNTREALLDAALERFSRHGFCGTSIRDLARSVGIRESSVYTHFASKQAVFDALVERADERLTEAAAQFGALTSGGVDAAAGYRGIVEAGLAAIARGMFNFVVGDPQFARLRRLLTIKQYRDADVSARFHDYLIARPLSFQTELFQTLFTSGEFRDGLDPEQTALAFFGPIHLLIQYADASGDEQHALELVTGHVQHFLRTHLKERS